MTSGRRSVWAKIRSQRSAPPGRGGANGRRDIFGAALEQSEQLFASAEATPPAARPILLYYGLSQAGRAIAAAHGANGSTGRSHGLTTSGLQGPVPDLVVRDKGAGAFQAIAEIVESPTLTDGAAFSQLYAGLPATVDVVLDHAGWPPALALSPERLDGGAVLHISGVAGAWIYGVPASLFSADDPRPGIAAFLQNYPTLAGWMFPTQAPNPVQVNQKDGHWGVRIQWMVDRPGGAGEPHRQARVRQAGVVVPGSAGLWVPPAIGGGDQPLAPIVAWWALLFAASMVARYEPSAWMSALHPDLSPAAVPIESFLEAALEQVPELILASLEDPRHWRPSGSIGIADP